MRLGRDAERPEVLDVLGDDRRVQCDGRAGDDASPPRLIVNDTNPVAHPESLAVGDEGDVVVTVECVDGGTDEFRVAVDASGPDAGVELNRTVTLTCPA